MNDPNEQRAARRRTRVTTASVAIGERVSVPPRSDSRPPGETRTWRVQAEIDRVAGELVRIARADVRDLFDARGRPLPPDEVPPAVRAGVKHYDVRRATKTVTGDGKRVTETVEVVRVELYSKLAALDALARHLGMYGRRSGVEIIATASPAEPTAALLDQLTAASGPAGTLERRAA